MNAGRILLITILWLICFVFLPLKIGAPDNPVQPSGPDAFMRLERVDILLQTGRWYDGHVPRAAAGQGADIHWTRPLDVLIIALAAPLFPFMDQHEAVELAGVVMPPLMSLVLVFLCIWAVRPLMRETSSLMVVVLLAVHPSIQGYFGLGRTDHHALLAVLAAAVLGLLIRLMHPGSLRHPALLAGALSGLGIWISQEFLIIYVPVVAALGACWLLWGVRWRQANLDFAIGCLTLCLVGIAVDVSPGDWFLPRYDRISIAQIFMVSCPLVFWLIVSRMAERLSRPAIRLGFAAGYGVFCLGALRLTYPGLFIGPIAEADPRLGPIWYDQVKEMLPLWVSPRQVILYCLLPFSGFLYGLLVLTGRIKAPDREMWLWLVLALLGTGALALAHRRAALYLGVAGVIAAAPLIEYLLDRIQIKFSGWRRNVTGLSVRALVLFGPFLLAVAVAAFGNFAEPRQAKAAISTLPKTCAVRDIAGQLSDPAFTKGRGMLRFINNIDYGPELIYRTPHHFLSVPYHRNGKTILDGHDLMTATNFAKSRELLDKYHINYILICPKASGEAYFEGPEGADSLYMRLVRDDLPKELTPVAISAPWKLFEYRERD